MVAELQHRTRNLLGVVRSIAKQTMAQTGPGETFRERFNDRLSALSRVQGLLSRSDQEPITLRALIETELAALDAPTMQGRIRLAGPMVRLRKATVQTFALALHELATNALKYGALGQPAGQLVVSWRVETEAGKDRLVLDWRERGVAMPEAAGSRRKGYGRQLIERSLPYDLGAETRLEFGPDGVHCTIAVPIGN
jgi:two-component system CheB/CheR fusion protein